MVLPEQGGTEWSCLSRVGLSGLAYELTMQSGLCLRARSQQFKVSCGLVRTVNSVCCTKIYLEVYDARMMYAMMIDLTGFYLRWALTMNTVTIKCPVWVGVGGGGGGGEVIK